MRSALCIPLFVLLLCGCAAADGQTPVAQEERRSICFDGKVVFVPIEGGFFGLASESGEKFDPSNLAESFRQDGLRVRVQARPLPRSIGTHMWGTKIEIIEIDRL